MKKVAIPPEKMQKPPEAKPRFPKKLLVEIREVKTPEERREYDRVLVGAFRGQAGMDSEGFKRFDGYFQNHRRFIALEGEPGRVVGTGMLAQGKESGKFAMLRFAVEKEFRKRGIAALMDAAIRKEAIAAGAKEVITFCFANMLERLQKAGYRIIRQLPAKEADAQPSWELEKKLE